MGYWNDTILPKIIDAGMRNPFMDQHRGRAAPLARGRVLEIGMGSGLNIPLYTSEVTHLFGLEPSAKLRELAGEPAADAKFQVDFLDASAESIPLDPHSVDTVVSSWTMCSIPDAEKALEEIRRVLKPDGSFVFIEHGRAPEAKLSGWQDRLAPLTRPILGCVLNRKMDDMIRDSGFEFSNIETGYFDGPKLISYHYVGQARPAA